MRQQVITQTGTGSSNWLVQDHHITPFNIGFAVVVSGTVTYTVEHCFDNILESVSATAFPNYSIQGQTTNQDGNYAFPVEAIRVTVSAGTGSATLTVLQAGITN